MVGELGIGLRRCRQPLGVGARGRGLAPHADLRAVDLEADRDAARVAIDGRCQKRSVVPHQLWIVVCQKPDVELPVRTLAHTSESGAECGARARQDSLHPGQRLPPVPLEGPRRHRKRDYLHFTFSSTPSTGSRCAYSKWARPSERSSSIFRHGPRIPARSSRSSLMSATSVL